MEKLIEKIVCLLGQAATDENAQEVALYSAALRDLCKVTGQRID